MAINDGQVKVKLPSSQKEAFNTWCEKHELNVSEEIRQMIDNRMTGNAAQDMMNDDKVQEYLREKEERARALRKKKLEFLQGGHAWVVGEIVQVDGPGDADWKDEVGNLYDEDLALLGPNGERLARFGGAGEGAFMFTMQPAILAGWVPKEDASQLTRERYKHVKKSLGPQNILAEDKAEAYRLEWERCKAIREGYIYTKWWPSEDGQALKALYKKYDTQYAWKIYGSYEPDVKSK